MDTKIKVNRIFTEICNVYGVNKKQILEKNRTKSVLQARSVAMWLCRQLLGLSYPDIGLYFKRDHTTCMLSIKKLANKIEKNPLLKGGIQCTIDRLNLIPTRWIQLKKTTDNGLPLYVCICCGSVTIKPTPVCYTEGSTEDWGCSTYEVSHVLSALS